MVDMVDMDCFDLGEMVDMIDLAVDQVQVADSSGDSLVVGSLVVDILVVGSVVGSPAVDMLADSPVVLPAVDIPGLHHRAGSPGGSQVVGSLGSPVAEEHLVLCLEVHRQVRCSVDTQDTLVAAVDMKAAHQVANPDDWQVVGRQLEVVHLPGMMITEHVGTGTW